MTPEALDQFFSFLYRGTIADVVFWLRFTAGVVSAILFAALILVEIKFRALLSGGAPPAEIPDTVPMANPTARAWEALKARIESPNPADWNLAVIQADSIFDGVLKEMGLPGETMGDRLKALDPSKLESLNDVWEAHKLRNRIAHDADRVLTQGEASRALRLFEKGLSELHYFGE